MPHVRKHPHPDTVSVAMLLPAKRHQSNSLAS
jgi:hypothetical protein